MGASRDDLALPEVRHTLTCPGLPPSSVEAQVSRRFSIIGAAGGARRSRRLAVFRAFRPTHIFNVLLSYCTCSLARDGRFSILKKHPCPAEPSFERFQRNG